MLPTRWEGKDIVVMDQVTVKGPGYRSEDCRAPKEAASALARVKKVVSEKSFLARMMMTGKAVSCERELALATIQLSLKGFADQVEFAITSSSSTMNARSSRSVSPRGPSPSYPPCPPSQPSPEDRGREDDTTHLPVHLSIHPPIHLYAKVPRHKSPMPDKGLIVCDGSMKGVVIRKIKAKANERARFGPDRSSCSALLLLCSYLVYFSNGGGRCGLG